MLMKFNAERLVQQAEPSRTIAKEICLESPELMRLCLQAVNMFFGTNTQMGPVNKNTPKLLYLLHVYFRKSSRCCLISFQEELL